MEAPATPASPMTMGSPETPSSEMAPPRFTVAEYTKHMGPPGSPSSEATMGTPEVPRSKMRIVPFMAPMSKRPMGPPQSPRSKTGPPRRPHPPVRVPERRNPAAPRAYTEAGQHKPIVAPLPVSRAVERRHRQDPKQWSQLTQYSHARVPRYRTEMARRKSHGSGAANYMPGGTPCGGSPYTPTCDRTDTRNRSPGDFKDNSEGGVQFTGFDVDMLPPVYRDAVKTFTSPGGGGEYKLGKLRHVYITSRHGNAVHQSRYNPYDKEFIVSAVVVGDYGSRMCHVYSDGTGTTSAYDRRR